MTDQKQNNQNQEFKMSNNVFNYIRENICEFIKDYDNLNRIQKQNPQVDLTIYIERMTQYYNQIPKNIIENARLQIQQQDEIIESKKQETHTLSEQQTKTQQSFQQTSSNALSFNTSQKIETVDQFLEEQTEEEIIESFRRPRVRKNERYAIGLNTPDYQEISEQMKKYNIVSRILNK